MNKEEEEEEVSIGIDCIGSISRVIR